MAASSLVVAVGKAPEQVQNFPQLVIKFILYFCFNLMVAGSNLSWQGIERKGSVH